MRNENERKAHESKYNSHPRIKLNELVFPNNQQMNKASIDNRQRMQDLTKNGKQYKGP